MISVTDKACEVIKGILESENKPDWAVRLRVVAGGCSGHSYSFDLDETVTAEDQKAATSNGVKVVVDKDSLQYVDGIEIDYVTTQLGGNFVFNNPNAKSSCGCGSSFATE